MNRDELVFGVAGSTATPAVPITLAEAGLREREHLQEWVLAHPEMLGVDVLIITSEFDRWMSREGREADRLDVLGLDADGRLVVTELKRDQAPDFVTLQSVKYAAMASRFEVEQLADAYLNFHSEEGDAPTTAEEALAVLRTHAPGLSSDTLRSPRIVLIAGSFPTTLTSSVVWLGEQGIDFTLIQVGAYRLGDNHLVTVSQVWPPPEAEDFVVAPSRAERSTKTTVTVPEAPWILEDLARLASTATSPTILATMDLCAAIPGEWIGGDQVMDRTGREKNAHRGDYGGFAITLRRRFNRSNAPYEMNYAVGDTSQQYYRLSPEVAQAWRQLRPQHDPPPPLEQSDEGKR
jgi:hypothetical protein